MRLITAWQVRSLAATTTAVAALYFITYFIVWAIITPVQAELLPELTRFASLLFLPHGIRVFATSLVGARSVPGLVLGELVGNYVFWSVGGIGPLLYVSLASGTITYVVFEALKAARVNAYYLQVTSEPPPLHTFILAGALASAANAFLVTAIMEGGMSIGHVTATLAAFMTGDLTGLLAVIMIARLVMPIIAARMNNQD